jgi:hypothetical protein
MRLNLKYLIPFFVLFNFLTIGVNANLQYSSQDYSRTAEYIQKFKSRYSQKDSYNYRHFFFNKNGIQYFISCIKICHDYFTQQILIIIKAQKSLFHIIGVSLLIFFKYIKGCKNKDSKTDLYEKVDSRKNICLACSFLHAMIIKTCNQLSFSKCINQRMKVAWPLKKSRSYVDGLLRLST